MVWLGVTGGIGSGKSTVMELLREKGVRTLDADILAKDLMRTDADVMRAVQKRFGADCYVDGELQTARLAARAFKDEASQAELNRIVHPVLKEYLEEKIRNSSEESGITAVEAALLLEAKYEDHFDYVCLVTADREIRLQRALQRGNAGKEDILRRMARQMPETEKRKKAHFIIENNGNPQELEFKVNDLLRSFREEQK